MKLFWFAFPAFLHGKQNMHSRLHVRPPTHTNQPSSVLSTQTFGSKVSCPTWLSSTSCLIDPGLPNLTLKSDRVSTLLSD
jgi:hypothetical protein